MNTCEVEFRINTATYESIVEHLTLCSSSFKPPLETYVNIKNYARKILNFATTFEAFIDDKLVGLAAVYYNNHESRTGFLTNLSLLESCQRRGIAFKLMSNVFLYGRENGFTRINLEAKIANEHALSFYERLGFKQNGISQDYYAMCYDLNLEANE